MFIIKIKKHNNNETPTMIGVGNWIDLRASERYEYKSGDAFKIDLGVSMEIPFGFEAHVVPRGSTFANWGIIQTNGVGIIDDSYKGDLDIWKMPVLAIRDGFIEKGDRVCQFRLMPIMQPTEFIEVDTLGNENRGGFGSTGISKIC